MHLAAVLVDCTHRLEEGSPPELVAQRLIEIEHALREDVKRRERRAPQALIEQWTTPRLGQLRQHPPVVLHVPPRYLRTQPPPNAPTISIVTPSYEQGRYLARTLWSVLDQHYPRLQYVVQDGGSSDETEAVLERFAGSLHHWASEPDDGQGDAINRGFAHTDGEIMAYLNSDDMLLPGSLAYVARYFAAHPDVDAVYGHRVLIDEQDRQIGRWVLPPHDPYALAVSDFVPQETLFWRRSIWERAGAHIDTSLRFAIDWDLLLRMQDAGAKMVRLPRFLGAFRVHEEQKTSRQQTLCEEETKLLHERVLGRALSKEETRAHVQGYLRKHVLHHTAHRLAERLPLERIAVRTVPVDEAPTSAFDRR
jgi:glycosyltransferase involved in cell wall biosynthesis